MIKKHTDLIFSLDKKSSDENKAEAMQLITRILPKQALLFGKIISFSFNSNSVQMAVSIHYGKSFRVVDAHKEYYIQATGSSVSVEDFQEQCVSEFVQKHQGYFTKVLLTLTGESTLYRTLILPDLKASDLATAVHFEVKKNIPFQIEDSIYDYRVIQKFKDGENNRVKISLHAATKEDISKQLAPFQKQNIKIDKILHAHDTIGQLLGLLKNYNKDDNYTLINIGKEITEISFYRGRTLEFARSSAISTEMLGTKGDPTKLEYFAESVANEIQNSLDFYAGQMNTNSSNNILLYGDFAYSDDFISILNTKIDTKLVRFPVDNLNISYAEEHELESFPVCLPVFATSVNHSHLPDLLPTEMKHLRKINLTNKYLRTAAAIIAITLSVSWVYMNSSIESLQTNSQTLEKQITIFKESDAYHTYKIIKQEIAFDKQYMNLSKEAPSYMHLNLKELSRITPDNVKLFHLDYNPINEGQNYFIQGIVSSDNIPPEISLAEFIENLSASQFYEDVQIVRHVKKKNKSFFEIEFLIKMKGIV